MRSFGFVWALIGLGLVFDLLALLPRAEAIDIRDRYEEILLQWGLKQTGLTVDPKPAGKRIERIVIAREKILAKSDPWPQFLNVVHVTTQEYVIRQELLITEGELWNPAKIAETERNLRNLSILATALTVACVSKREGSVILLVITKDLWSIRFNSNYNLVGTVLRSGELFPTEMNFLGRNKQLSLNLSLSYLDLPSFRLYDNFGIGQLYYDPRFWGSRFQFYERVTLYFNGTLPCAGSIGAKNEAWCPRQPLGSFNGILGQVGLAYPLYSLASRFGFSINGSVYYRQIRFYRQNPDNQPAPPGEQHGVSIRTVQMRHTDGEIRAIPRAYDLLRLNLTASFTHSYGTEIKHDLSWGAVVYSQQTSAPEGFKEIFDRQTMDWYQRNLLARGESAVYAFLGYRVRPTTFLRRRNIAAFALTEDIALGPSLSTEIRFAKDLLLATHAWIELLASGSYRWNLAEHLLTLGASAFTRWHPLLYEIGYRAPWANQSLQAYLLYVSPLVWIGRFHLYSVLLLRNNDLSRTTSTLGGDTGLRGYLSSLFEGQHLFRVNAEFRSLPLNLFTVHVGFVIFYDGGSVFGGENPSKPGAELPFLYKQSVGFGLRLQVPQFDREAIRIDLGFPLSEGGGSFGSWFSLSFGQVF